MYRRFIFITAETVEFVNKHNIERFFCAVFNHTLKIGAVVVCSRHFSEILNACVSALLFSLLSVTFGSIQFVHFSFIYLMGRRHALRPEHSFIPFCFRYITILSVLLPIPKLLPLSFQKKTHFSSSDNAVMTGIPTVTTSSSVFSTFITSSHLIF